MGIDLELVAVLLPLLEDVVFKWDGQETGVLSEQGCPVEGGASGCHQNQGDRCFLTVSCGSCAETQFELGVMYLMLETDSGWGEAGRPAKGS